jgi:ABC-type lipoprotein export system ATPase subunit
MDTQLLLRLNMAKIKCGVSLPGVNQKQYKDLMLDQSKLRDFLFVLPMIWSTIVNFGISVYKMETSDIYPVRSMFALFCVFMCGFITYLTDPTVYEKTKPNPKTVTRFNDSQYVKLKLSMGCILDTEFEEKKKAKIDAQQDIQKYVILIINLIVTYISLIGKSLGQLHSFGNISWMIGCLADNIKSLQYYSYMKEYIQFTKCLESHRIESDGTADTNINEINKVEFVNASYGYYDDLMKNPPAKTQKIFNLTYTYRLGYFYYIEGVNGLGKTTALRMFTDNLFSGDVYFGNINRSHLSFDDISKNIFFMSQASEYTPQFSKEEINSYKGRDYWLEKQLGLTELFDKDTVEMSGGQKKRMSIYIALTSKATVLLLDEILSELSTEETPDVPEGGGWLQRVINTMVEWDGRKDKIILLVGHGCVDLIPKRQGVIKLKMTNSDVKTLFTTR